MLASRNIIFAISWCIHRQIHAHKRQIIYVKIIINYIQKSYFYQKYIFFIVHECGICWMMRWTMFRACALGLRKDIQKHYGIAQHSRISVPLHVICYRVKITQRNYCTFRGRSPRIFRLFCRNVEKERSMIA